MDHSPGPVRDLKSEAIALTSSTLGSMRNAEPKHDDASSEPVLTIHANFKGFRFMPPTLEAVGDSSKRTLREIELIFFLPC